MYMLVRQYTLCTEHEDVLGFIPSYVLYSKQIGNVYARCCLQETLLLSDNLFFWTAANKTKIQNKIISVSTFVCTSNQKKTMPKITSKYVYRD